MKFGTPRTAEFLNRSQLKTGPEVKMSKGNVLIFSAHADDAEFFAGGTVAKFIAEGFDVYEVITTNNERGSFDLDRATLISDSRDKEAREAAGILGKKEIYFLEYPDGFLGDYPINELREKFMRFIRRIKPAIVMTFDPWAPFETHPDHRAVAMAATEAVGFAHMPLFHPEHLTDGLSTHMVPEVYYFAKNGERVNKYVDISDFVDKKIEALCAHTSQMRLTIEDIRLSLLATGSSEEEIAFLDKENFRPLIDFYIRKWAESIGEKGGLPSAEEFRYEKAGDLVRGLLG